MPTMKWFLSSLALAVVLGPLSGCGGSQHGAGERYYLVAANIKLPYWQAAASGLNRAAIQLKVKAEMVGPDVYDPKLQQQEFQRVVRLKPAGILISPANPDLLKPDIDAAVEAGIPVITLDSDSPSSKRLLFIGTNNYQAGVMGGQVAARELNGKGNLAVLTIPGQANLEERLNGYRSVLDRHPQIKIVEIIDIKGDARLAFDAVTRLLERGTSKVDGFLCLEASGGKGVAEVLDRKKVQGAVLVAMDTDAETLEWVQKGVIAATIAQKPFTMGYHGLKMLDDLYHHKPRPLAADWAREPFSVVPTFVDTGATLVNKDNVELFLKARDFATAEEEQ